MDEANSAPLRWDHGRTRWRRRTASDASLVATNGAAMLVRVVLHPGLHVGSRVDVELGGGAGVVEIRHIAPTGDADGAALVGAELVDVDDALAAHLLTLVDLRDGGANDRWWWQRGP